MGVEYLVLGSSYYTGLGWFLEGVEHSVRGYGTVGLCYCRGKVRVL